MPSVCLPFFLERSVEHFLSVVKLHEKLESDMSLLRKAFNDRVQFVAVAFFGNPVLLMLMDLDTSVSCKSCRILSRLSNTRAHSKMP